MDGHLKRLSILGSTGSVGNQTLEVVRAFPEQFDVVGLASNKNREDIISQSKEFLPRFIACNALSLADTANLPESTNITDLAGVATADNVDILVTATAGHAALPHTFDAINLGRNIAIANKETIVMAGSKLTEHVKARGCSLLPLDSEPSAIWQCLRGEESPVSRLFITASGGAFRNRPLGSLSTVTPTEALAHPTWKMGPKITIDSATMMNKALEIIEAHWLFDIPADRIDVVVHPESIIHSVVEFVDGSSKAQVGPPDMRVPIQVALSFPDRWPADHPRLDWTRTGPLTFEAADTDRFPCLGLAYAALRADGSSPAALNAANEVAVARFLDGSIRFPDVPRLVEAGLAEIVHDDGYALPRESAELRANCRRLAGPQEAGKEVDGYRHGV